MRDCNLPHIDWSLQRPTPTPGSKLMQFIAYDGRSHHVQEPTVQNNILEQVITTGEALIVALQIKDKIGDHRAIQYSLQIEKEATPVSNNNYNFRRANFDAMRDDLDDEILELLVVNSDAAPGI